MYRHFPFAENAANRVSEESEAKAIEMKKIGRGSLGTRDQADDFLHPRPVKVLAGIEAGGDFQLS